MLNLIEHEDLKKTRRSLYGASLFTAAVANTNFLSNEISIFKLKMSVQQTELISIGRFGIAALTLLFVLHLLSLVTKNLKRIGDHRYEVAINKLKVEEGQLYQDIGAYRDHDADYEPDDFDAYFTAKRARELRTNTRVKYLDRSYSIFKQGLLDYCLVLIVAATIFFNPTIAKQVLAYF